MEDIITSSNVVFEDWESDVAVRIWKLRNSSWDAVKFVVIIKLNAGS